MKPPYFSHFASLQCFKIFGEAIGSILSQTFTDFDLIIINGSTDDSQTIIDQFTDKRIIVFQKPNTGLIDTLNLGVSYGRANLDCQDGC